MILSLDKFEKEVLIRAVGALIENEKEVINQGLIDKDKSERIAEIVKLVESLRNKIANLR
jgi:hydroxymethylpyrimidine pyrophosphatase-like HAD family hydrolase